MSVVKNKVLVSVIMGSRSDEPVMDMTGQVLKKFSVPYETKIVSAHRTPRFMQSYALNCHKRGVQVIVAGAGGAAHLPGMVASLTRLPVIGVPVMTKTLKGLDSLLSIVQMPKGVPVAGVAVDNAYNAGLLALRILALSRPILARKINTYIKEQAIKSKNS